MFIVTTQDGQRFVSLNSNGLWELTPIRGRAKEFKSETEAAAMVGMYFGEQDVMKIVHL